MDKERKLYVDGLNFSEKLGFVKKVWYIPTMEAGVKRFVEACRNAGWEPTIFIDAGIESGEALEKWKSRREKEVSEAVKDVPHGTNSLMGDIFRQNKVTVHYSPWNADNDDCLAYFAQRDGASILSNDIDLARYVGKTYEQYGSFEYGLAIPKEELNSFKGREVILLKSKKIDERRLPPPRELLKEEPKMLEKHPGFVSIKETGEVVRGSPCFSTKFYGNLHGHVRKTRYLFYHQMGFEYVKEIWPEFKGGKIKWTEKKWKRGKESTETNSFPPCEASYEILLSSIKERKEKVPDFSDCERFNFEMACILIIAELYAYRSDVPMIGIVKRLLDYTKLHEKWAGLLATESEKNVPSACRNWKADGVCDFGEKCFAASGHFTCKCWRGKQCRYRH